MTRTELLRVMIDEAGHGEYSTLRGLIDYLVNEKHYDPFRLVLIAKRALKIPESIAVLTIVKLS